MIYYIATNDEKYVKIGCASFSVFNRLREIQACHPLPLKLLAVEKGSQSEERSLHRRFSIHRCRGEWFFLRDDLKEYINELSKDFSLPDSLELRDDCWKPYFQFVLGTQYKDYFQESIRPYIHRQQEDSLNLPRPPAMQFYFQEKSKLEEPYIGRVESISSIRNVKTNDKDKSSCLTCSFRDAVMGEVFGADITINHNGEKLTIHKVFHMPSKEVLWEGSREITNS